jgi:hypothetical protein
MINPRNYTKIRRTSHKKFLVFVSFLLVLFSGLPLVVRAATLYLMPQSQTVYRGDNFLIEIRLDTEGEEVNAVEANLKFPSDLLKITDFSKGGSILTFWPQEPDFKENSISFTGGIPGGFKGEGLILKINFLGKEIGKAEVNFKDDSKVLLNDGKGTPAKLNFLEGNYEIIEKPEKLPKISSRTHPDQNKWYKETTLHLHWDLIEGAEYSFILSKDPLAEPDEIPDKPESKEGLAWIGDMEYPNLEDGIYYFHLRERRGTDADLNAEQRGKWGPKITFRAMVDSTSPEDFKPEIGKDPTIFGGKYFLSFATTDLTSGVQYFEIKEGKRDFKRAESPYLLEDQSLENKILVKAVDKAGNEKISEIIPPAKPFPYWIIFVIIVCLVIIYWIIKRYFLKRQQ